MELCNIDLGARRKNKISFNARSETYNTASKARKQKAEEAEEKVNRKKLTFQTGRVL